MSSGWLPEPPAGWRASRLKFEADVRLGKMLQSEAKREDDVLLPYVRAASVGQGGSLITEDAKSMWFSASEACALAIAPNDILVVEGGDVGRSVLVRGGASGWGFQNSVNRVRAGEGNDPRFLHYFLLMARETGFIKVYCDVVSIPHLTAEKLSRLPLNVPRPAEQRAIADYLDRETARIDKLIEEQQRLIEMLVERRESVVDLVLASYGFACPSDLERPESWQVPVGWKVVLLGAVLEQLTNGFVGPTRDILVDEGIRYIQGTHIKNGAIDFDRRPFYVRRDWHDQRPRIHLREGDVLIVQTGDIGKVAVVPPEFGEASCHALQIARVRSERVTGRYLGAYLSSRLGYNSLVRLATGALHPHLEAGIRNAPVVVPPLALQGEVVERVTHESQKIDALIGETERFIELSRERRAALITAAVTGQIDVQEGA